MRYTSRVRRAAHAVDTLSEDEIDLLSRTRYHNKDGIEINHVTVEQFSRDWDICQSLWKRGWLKYAGSESKTQIRRAKLDPNKQWVAFYCCSNRWDGTNKKVCP